MYSIMLGLCALILTYPKQNNGCIGLHFWGFMDLLWNCFLGVTKFDFGYGRMLSFILEFTDI